MREGAICWKLIGSLSKMCIIMKTLFLIDISSDLRGIFVCLFYNKKVFFAFVARKHIQMIEMQQGKKSKH